MVAAHRGRPLLRLRTTSARMRHRSAPRTPRACTDRTRRAPARIVPAAAPPSHGARARPLRCRTRGRARGVAANSRQLAPSAQARQARAIKPGGAVARVGFGSFARALHSSRRRPPARTPRAWSRSPPSPRCHAPWLPPPSCHP
eukprot:scaffold246720_cov27-Tisochrysis_lutea.AAC.2